MANLLYVKANPKVTEQSISLRLGERFVSAFREFHPNHTVTTLDVYADNVPLLDADVFNGWGKLAKASELSYGEQTKVKRLGELVEQFIAADVVVFALPMWNFGFPPMLKAYMDAVAVAGKTFQYTATGPQGLLQGKKAVILEARGGFYGDSEDGTPNPLNHSAAHLRVFLNFLGITDIQVVAAEGLSVDPSQAESILEAAAGQAGEIAKQI
ncbi:MAG TPA: FMN-dependent NADH-azoreductase [Herpetosiphonaceae bacterium]